MKSLGPDERRVIDDAKASDVPSPDAEARIWQSLAARLGAPLPPLAEEASHALDAQAGAGLAAGLSTKLLVLVLSVGALSLGGVLWYFVPGLSRRAEVSRPAESSAATPVAAAEATARADPSPSGSLPAEAPAVSSLSQETHLIAEAQRALNDADPAGALRWIDRHQQRFPAGVLAQERAAARVFALCALGRDREAREARQRFLRSWPDSPLQTRVRAPCLPAHKPASAAGAP